MLRCNKKGSWEELSKMILPIMGFIVLVSAISAVWSTAQASNAAKLSTCATSLKWGRAAEDWSGALKYVLPKAPNFCDTLESHPGSEGGKKEDVERQIMDLMAQGWKETLEGSPETFQHQLFKDKACFIVFIFDIQPTPQFKEGDIIRKEDFMRDLGVFTYSTFPVNGEDVEFTYLDYIQEKGDYGGMVQVFPETERDDFCTDTGGNKLSDEVCAKKRAEVGFRPKNSYSIAVVSPQGAIKVFEKLGLKKPQNVNYVIVGSDAEVKGMCNVVVT